MSSGIPFADMVGIEQISIENGVATVAMQVSPDLHNRRGVAHGGAIATLIDSAMACAARSLEDNLKLGGTVDLNIHFMSPGTGRLEAVACVLQCTRTLAFCQGEVRDERNALVATAMATISLRRNNPPAA